MRPGSVVSFSTRGKSVMNTPDSDKAKFYSFQKGRV